MSDMQTTSPASNITIKQRNSTNKLFGFNQSRIIIIDGNESDRRELNSLLKDWQCDIQCFASVEDAILVLDNQAWKPQLIISDIPLADLNSGRDTIKLFQNFYACYIPSIILTYDKDQNKDHLLKDSYFIILQKPIKAAQLRFVMKKKISVHTTHRIHSNLSFS